MKRPNVALDIDETLLFSIIEVKDSSSNITESICPIERIPDYEFTTPDTHVRVFYRPGLKLFLQKCLVLYNVFFFTASSELYANIVLNQIEKDFNLVGKFSNRLYRQDCTLYNGKFLKDLRSISSDLSCTVLLDNCSMSMILQPGNGILAPPFHGKQNDSFLQSAIGKINQLLQQKYLAKRI